MDDPRWRYLATRPPAEPGSVVGRTWPDGRCDSRLASDPEVQAWIAEHGEPDPIA